jgi:uncharacterized protein YjlB
MNHADILEKHPRLAGAAAGAELRLIRLPPNGWVPNHAALPVVLYHQVLDTGLADLPDEVDRRFARNGWPVQWRDSVFDYHHFHATAHEVMAVLGGSADLMLGGPGGYTVRVAAGDALLLPAGTGHCRLEAYGAFKVAGGYPVGQQWDIRRDALTAEELHVMLALPYPSTDPVFGEHGPVADYWMNAERARA